MGKRVGKTKSGGEDGLTPAMRQYAAQKAAAPDALLLFRMGDFYEMFYEDAETAARVLGIALTSRGKGRDGASIPLAGIPYHALEGYLVKLVRAGFKVAISEQVEDPKTAKGVVQREVVRIVTPGTLTDDALLEQKADNYLACVCCPAGRSPSVARGQPSSATQSPSSALPAQSRAVGPQGYGLAFVELSTGAFWVQMMPQGQVVDELVRLGPAELLLAEASIEARNPLEEVLGELGSDGRSGVLPLTRRSAHLFDPYQARERLLAHFGVATLEGFGFEEMDASLCAAGVILEYLAETQKTALGHITRLSRRQAGEFMSIDHATWRSLEIERTVRGMAASGSLLHAIDRTVTAMGGRCLRRWLAAPLRDSGAIGARQDAVADLLADAHRRDTLRGTLSKLADIERITARLGVGRASPRDLVALGQTLLAVEEVAKELATSSSGGEGPAASFAPGLLSASSGGPSAGTGAGRYIAERAAALTGLHELAVFLSTALRPDAPLTLNDGGIIAAGHDPELDRLLAIGADGQAWLAEYQAREIQRTGIPSLKVGFNQVFGYYIEITHLHRDRVPADYVRKQTVKNAERYITDELKRYETEVLTARERAFRREAELFEAIRRKAAEHISALQRVAAAVAEIDVIAGLAHLADQRRYVRPELAGEPVLEINDGRHPVLEQTLGEKFVPNDCVLGELQAEPAICNSQSASLMVLTGPNMAGKSTFIRQVALLVLLAQTGSYVPARSMRLGPADRIFARIGASDEISRGQSTFMVEMTEAANILNNATRHSLVILDELGRGTSTFDGLALAWAVAEDLVKRIGCRTLFATHYHELTRLEADLSGAVNYNVAVREWQEQVVFLYRILRGATDQSYGIHVARLAGIPPEVIARSRKLLAELESLPPDVQQAVRRGRRAGKGDGQLLLFRAPADEVVDEIRGLDCRALTPDEALKAIQGWRRRLEDEQS